MKYSQQTGCFYPDNLNYFPLPSDCIDVSLSDHANAMNKSIHSVIEVNNGVLIITQPAALTDDQLLAKAKITKIDSIKNSCANAITSGCSSSALGMPHIYPTQITDQNNLSANVLSSFYPDLPSDWTTQHLCADSSGHWEYKLHTALQIQTVGMDVKNYILAQLIKSENLKLQVQLALSLAEVDNIKW